MYSVIIVDDEPIVREGIEYLIDWKKEGFEIIDSAENGLEGLALITEKMPDLVITDIKMPGLDGLQMVKQAQESNCQTKFIILSGYSDFKFAQDAITYGAVQYLLKPIDEEELMGVLFKVKQQLAEELKDEKTKRYVQSYIENQQIYSYVIHGEKTEEVEKLRPYSIFKLIKLSDNGRKINTKMIVETCNTVLNERHYIYTYGDSVFILVAANSDITLDDLIAQINSENQLNVTISSVERTIEHVPDLYKEIKFLDSQRYFYPNKGIMTQQVLNKNNAVHTLDKLIINLKLAIKDNRKEEIEETIDFCVDYFQVTKQDSQIVKREWSIIFMECVAFLEASMQKPIKEIEKDKLLSVIWKESSIQQTAHFLKYVFYDFGRFFYETNEKQDIVDEIKRYTERNYHKNLSLKELAQEFNYSQSYLGKKFKSDTGTSYHMYLDDLRLNKAKELLKDSNHYIYEIAKKVGYSNYDYFHKKFKSKFNISPKEYQKKQEEGD
ncbi:DNA-binding response regulator [Alkalibacterium pelagium]|uniref:Two-component system, response regulator YesN n=1 Tax=Alkalibacterium pelagium TaxID=426702 RepID=A0A1H7ID51_9LACT|nr:DNA-binding response regulator [Alkalibacterium pelagium]SEK60493.1 two-component system, response regulator YesN [Alkalibacterium pelagium]